MTYRSSPTFSGETSPLPSTILSPITSPSTAFSPLSKRVSEKSPFSTTTNAAATAAITKAAAPLPFSRFTKTPPNNYKILRRTLSEPPVFNSFSDFCRYVNSQSPENGENNSKLPLRRSISGPSAADIILPPGPAPAPAPAPSTTKRKILKEFLNQVVDKEEENSAPDDNNEENNSNNSEVKFSPKLSREYRPYKPDPSPLLHICSTWEVQSNEVMMIGDSLKDDVACGKRAGAFTCLLDETGRYDAPEYAYVEHQPDYKVSSLVEVQSLLERDFELTI